MTYRICEDCGVSLDPGEVCDCQSGEAPVLECRQQPLIFDNLDAVRQNLDSVVAQVKGLPRCDESLKQVRAIRAKLAKDFDSLEQQRKAVKNQVMEPYLAAEERYKQAITEPYQVAQSCLKSWVDSYQNDMKGACEKRLEAYFTELCQAKGIHFLRFAQCGITVDMATARQKEPRKAMEAISAYVESVRSDLDAIAQMPDAQEVLAQYRENPDLSQAVTAVQRRKQQEEAARACLEQQQRRLEELEAHRDSLAEAAPGAVQPPQEHRIRLPFVATGTLAALKAMKAFALTLGITFEDMQEEKT